MEAVNLGAFLTFVVVTTFTPGPNNITCSSMGVLYGYQKTLKYILGIVTGFFAVMFLSGFISGALHTVFPAMEKIMRIFGAGYILWLAYKTFKSTYQFSEEEAKPLGFANGLLLQALNPKGMVFGLTLYTTFLVGITGNIFLILITAIFLAIVGFMATSTWAISGAAIKQFLHNPRFQKAINTALALLLVYTAIELSGIFH